LIQVKTLGTSSNNDNDKIGLSKVPNYVKMCVPGINKELLSLYVYCNDARRIIIMGSLQML
jgi:hypothetical protein